MSNAKQNYLALVEKRKQEKAKRGDVLSIEMPSGAVWKYLPIKVQQYAIAGKVPMHLIAKLESVQNQPSKEMTQAEMVELGMSAMTITRDVMLNNLVEPKISLEETDDTITPEQIDPEDFEFFMKFVMFGGQADADLKSRAAAPKRKRAA